MSVACLLQAEIAVILRATLSFIILTRRKVTFVKHVTAYLSYLNCIFLFRKETSWHGFWYCTASQHFESFYKGKTKKYKYFCQNFTSSLAINHTRVNWFLIFWLYNCKILSFWKFLGCRSILVPSMSKKPLNTGFLPRFYVFFNL